MIRDQSVTEELNAEWEAVEEMLDVARSSWTETEVAPGILDFTRDLSEMTANLCVVFALGVLEHALLQLRDEKVFRSEGSRLSSLMVASRKGGLTWLNYQQVDYILRYRNRIAHKQQRFSEDECLEMILAIKAQLESWSIVKPKKTRFERKVWMFGSAEGGKSYTIEIAFPALQRHEEGERLIEDTVTAARDATRGLPLEKAKRYFATATERVVVDHGLQETVRYSIRFLTDGEQV